MDERITYCGGRCDLCLRYIATQSKDPAQLAAVAELWHRLGWRDRILSADEISCQGCTPSSWCRYGIAACAAGRNVANCGECADYPDCTRLQDMFQRNAVYHEICKQRCTPEEYARLRESSFSKRRYLDKAQKNKP
ncbi:MAG: DUF3795 domain-containing protein [candidate division FCPU426 bacterium]